MQPKLAVAYTRLVTISTEDQLSPMQFRDAVGAQ